MDDRQDHKGLNDENPEGIAIIGMAGRFPGASDVQTFWDNIKHGVEGITHFSLDQLDVVPDETSPEATATFVPAKGILDNVDMFDANFFGYYPKEAAQMDPQHRVFLENCWEALEISGYDPERYEGAIGVYAGCYMDTYILSNLCSNREFLERLVESIQVGTLQTELGNDKDYLATRVSFKLNLKGPSLTVQTACSTSLVAICHACQSLQTYSSDIALAGGVTITFPHRKGYFYREEGMVSGDGHCRPFDSNAQGTVFSNASAVIVLKRLEDALADRDTINAVIKGYGCNNDGAHKLSFTAPSMQGQAEVITLAQAMAGYSARSIGYIEAHGTATPLGDPIEIQALTQAFRQTTDENGFCAIGSLKANIGHLDVASGATGIIKTALALNEKVLPPSINFNQPNPKIDFQNSPFYVNTMLKPWETDGNPRRAGVSSFGVGGTNAHVVLEEGPGRPQKQPAIRDYYLLPLSAKTESALEKQALRLAGHLRSHPDTQLADIAYTLQTGRAVFGERCIVVCRDHQDACSKLKEKNLNPLDRARESGGEPSVIFMFPGQGAQFPNMAKTLYESDPVFTLHFDRCADALIPHLGQDLRELLYNQSDEKSAAEVLRETGVTQPAIFSIEYALAQLWINWGLEPEAFVGHSVGEITAACLAGVFTLDDALRLVTTRGRLMQGMPKGAMLSVRASIDRISDLLTSELSIAAINAPELCVVSGPFDAIDGITAKLDEIGIPHSRLHSSHAFHSAMMEPVVSETVKEVEAVSRNIPLIPIFSTVTGNWLSDEEAVSPEYWGRNLRDTVRFADAVAALDTENRRIFLEVGPGQTLSTLAKQIIGVNSQSLVFPSLGHVQQQNSDYLTLITTAGRLWLGGIQFDWEKFGSGQGYRIPLPTYPFERKRHWVEPTLSDKHDIAAQNINDVNTAKSATINPGAVSKETTGLPEIVDRVIKKQIQIMAKQLAMVRKVP